MTAGKKHPDLYKKTFKGAIWTFLQRFCNQLLAYVKWLILARLLHPRDFGIFGIALLLLEFFNTITQMGLRSALIRQKEDIRDYLNPVWTIGIIRGLLLFLILWICAPFAAHFFEGTWEWKKREILKPQQFLETIYREETPLTLCIRKYLAEANLQEPFESLETSEATASEALASALNTLCRKEKLKDFSPYYHLRLSPHARELLGKELKGKELYRANRLFLEDIYPDFFQRKILNQAELTLVIRLMSILLLIGTFGNVGTIYFQKELDFQKLFLLHTTSSFLSIVLTIGLSLFYRNVWPLVCGYAVSVLSALFLGYYLYPYKPRLEIDLVKIGRLWNFGKWLTLSGILGFFLTHGDDLFVGKILGAGALGFYLMAYKISNLPTTEITEVLLNVTFPAYSKIQDDLFRLRAAYEKMIATVTLLTFFFSGLVCLFANDFVSFCMGSRWKPIVPCIQVLALWGCIRPLGVTSGPIFMSRGCPAYITKIQVFKLIILAGCIYPLTQRYGFTGTALAVLISSFLAQFPTMKYLKKVLLCRHRDLLSPLWLPLWGVVWMALDVILLRGFLFQRSSPPVFIFLALTALLVYFGSIWILDLFLGKRWVALCLEQWYFFLNSVSKYFNYGQNEKNTGDWD